MLRKHLQRLEQPLEDEDEPESAHDMIPDEAYIEDDAKGIYALCCSRFFVLAPSISSSLLICISILWKSVLQMSHFHQSPLERIKKLKTRLDHFHHNCCMMMKMKKLLILKRTELYW